MSQIFFSQVMNKLTPPQKFQYKKVSDFGVQVAVEKDQLLIIISLSFLSLNTVHRCSCCSSSYRQRVIKEFHSCLLCVVFVVMLHYHHIVLFRSDQVTSAVVTVKPLKKKGRRRRRKVIGNLRCRNNKPPPSSSSFAQLNARTTIFIWSTAALHFPITSHKRRRKTIQKQNKVQTSMRLVIVCFIAVSL